MRRPKPLNLSNFRDTSKNPSAQSGNPIMHYYPGADHLGSPTAEPEPEVEIHTTPSTFNLYIETPDSDFEDDDTPPPPRSADTMTAHPFFDTIAGLPQFTPLDDDDLQLVDENNEINLERQDAEYPIGEESETENTDEDSKSEPAYLGPPLVPFLPIDTNETEHTYQNAINLPIGALDNIEEAGFTFSLSHASATF